MGAAAHDTGSWSTAASRWESLGRFTGSNAGRLQRVGGLLQQGVLGAHLPPSGALRGQQGRGGPVPASPRASPGAFEQTHWVLGSAS